MSTQVRNNDMVNLLDPDFVKRTEPNFAWKSACSAIMALPGLRAFWPMSAVDYQNPYCTDISGHGYDLTTNATIGNVTFGYPTVTPLVPTVNLTAASSQYLSRADGGAGNWADIAGTEAYIEHQGISFGGWFRSVSGTGNGQTVIGKLLAAGNQRSYFLYIWGAGAGPPFSAYAFFSQNGVATNGAVSTVTVGINEWHFAAGSLDTSTGTAYLQLDSEIFTGATGYNAVFDSTADLNVGALQNGTTNFFDGRLSLVYLAASYHTPAQMLNLYHQTRSMFGV